VNLTYQTEEDIENSVNQLTGESIEESKFDVFTDKFMRHITLEPKF